MGRGNLYLERFPGEVGAAYLDNFDWDWGNHPEIIQEQAERYRELYSLEMSHANSQKAHFDQATIIERKSADQCFVLFDDTYWDGTTWSGKGGTAVPYLLSKGFTLLDHRMKSPRRTKQFAMLGRGTILNYPSFKAEFAFYKAILSPLYLNEVAGVSQFLRSALPELAFNSVKGLYHRVIGP